MENPFSSSFGHCVIAAESLQALPTLPLFKRKILQHPQGCSLFSQYLNKSIVILLRTSPLTLHPCLTLAMSCPREIFQAIRATVMARAPLLTSTCDHSTVDHESENSRTDLDATPGSDVETFTTAAEVGKQLLRSHHWRIG